MRILWRIRLLALGDRNPDFLTHREIDSTLKLLPADVDCRWVATDDPRARELARYDGVWLLPGTLYRDDEAAYAAIGHCQLRSGACEASAAALGVLIIWFRAVPGRSLI